MSSFGPRSWRLLLPVLAVTLVACQSNEHTGKARPDSRREDIGAQSGDVLRVDIDNGTWINVDLSPDGTTVVFDILGDIFTLPVAGGTAEPLIQGSSFDGHPQFSPDGRSIAFISDRSGLQNIWTVELSSGELRQVSFESSRQVSGPSWSSDGRYIAGRKHFTAKRTIGAGELWSYPATGGKGTALVERDSSQKDINEPSFSSDGRYLYYSQDVWPGSAFEYNKDPSKGIYSIKQLDLESGRVRTVAEGTGGAVRPVPSPDGRHLAYIKRTGSDSSLILRDLSDGRDKTILSGLDRDLQQVWGTHGMYPDFAWTSDGAAIVLWTTGRISMVDIATGVPRQIPFRVRQSYDYRAPPTPQVAIPSGWFPVRGLRWVTISPDGNDVAFQALGRIYLRPLSGGTPHLLTGPEGEGRFEFYPSFSPDGQWLVYTTWRDDTLGDVRRTHIETGETEILSTEPGHYVEPRVNRDQSTVVYRRDSGGVLLAPGSVEKSGLYMVAWEGGEPVRIVTDGSSPEFCAGSADVYFTRMQAVEDLPPHDAQWLNFDRLLVRIDPASGEEEVIANVGLASELELSPDCTRLAWVVRSQLRTAALPDGADLPLDFRTGAYIVPDSDGGWYLSWSDGNILHWALGANISRWEPFENSAKPLSSDIGFDAPIEYPNRVRAYVGADIVTMGPMGTIEDAVLVAEGDRITAIGTRKDVDVSDEAQIVDFSGSTLLPGFVDSHWHGVYAVSGITPTENWTHRVALSHGITTLFDPYAPTADVFAAAELGMAGKTVSPRIYSTGSAVYGADSDISASIANLSDAAREVRRRTAFGAIAVKSYLLPRRDQQQWLLAAAEEAGVRVIAEQAMATPTISAQILDGHNSIEHNLPYARVYDDLIQVWSKSGVNHTPTLTVPLGGLWSSNYWLKNKSDEQFVRQSRHFPPGYVGAQYLEGVSPELHDQVFPAAAREVAKLHGAGVRVLVGEHAQLVGMGYHWELWMLAMGGMSNRDIIAAATIEGARHLGLDEDIGSLEVGKRVDFSVFDGNPLRDIRESETIRYVAVAGKLYDVGLMMADPTVR